jgi:hypothetical protein
MQQQQLTVLLLLRLVLMGWRLTRRAACRSS